MEFLQGINLLNTINVLSEYQYKLFITGILTMVVGGIFAYAFFKEKYKVLTTIMLVFMLIGDIGIIFALCRYVKHPDYEYEVMIDETVKLTEFDDKYEILKHEGEIWKIRMK